jgi:hypothetical protein
MLARSIIAALLTALVWSVASLAQPVGFPPFAAPGNISIGTPQSLGYAGVFGGGAASQALNYSANVLSGDMLVACVNVSNAAAVTNTSVSDGTNSYTLAEQATFGSGTFLNIWYKANASPVSSGTTLTASLSGGMSGTNVIQLGAWRVPGVITSPLDAVNQNKATSATTVTVSTGALAKANEIIAGCGAINNGATNTSYSASGFSTVLSGNPTGSNNYALGMSDLIVSTTTSVNFAPAFGGSGGTMYGAVATLKGH